MPAEATTRFSRRRDDDLFPDGSMAGSERASSEITAYAASRTEVRVRSWSRTLFEDVYADRIIGTLTMFDRMIFGGHLTRLFAPGAISAMLWQPRSAPSPTSGPTAG